MPPKTTESGTFYAVTEMADGKRRYSTVSEIETMPDFNPTLIEKVKYLIKRWNAKWVKLTHQVLRALRR